MTRQNLGKARSFDGFQQNRTLATVDPRKFWAYGEFVGECFEWAGRVSPGMKYGRIRLGNATVGVHRIAWMLSRGVQMVPANYEICHHCDNPRCIRPDHLYLGTQAQNMQDRIDRKRGGVGSYINVEGVAA